MTIEIGSTVCGTVLRVTEYGAIVRLGEGKIGLVHISEIADTYVRDVREYINENDQVRVKVIRLDNKGRYELSMKQCGAAAAVEKTPEATGAVRSHRVEESRPVTVNRSPATRSPLSFEDRLSRFLKDSEERQHDLKRHIEAKRGKR